MNVFSFLSEAAQKWPDAPAVIDEDGVCSFCELNSIATRLISELEQHKVLPGRSVGMVAKNGRRFIAGLFALLGVGCVAMPIPPEVKASELDEIARKIPLSHILLVDPFSRTFADIGKSDQLTPGFSLVKVADAGVAAAHVPNAAVIRFSSGTTSQAKGVVLSHKSIEERTRFGAAGLGLGPGDVVTWVLPMAHHFIVSVLLYVRSGVAIAVAPSTLARSIIETTNNHSATLLYASPLIVQLLASDPEATKMPSLHRVISTASGLSSAAAERFYARFGIRVSQAYGVIEVGLPLCNLDGKFPDSVGRPLPGYEAAILGPSGETLSDGAIGRLGLRGPGMFDGYLVPERTRNDVLEHGWFMTGDLASIDGDGAVTVRGREKSVINTGGNKVFPEEIEEVLERFAGVKNARVRGVPHPLLGELVTAEIIPDRRDLDVEAVRKHCYTHLSPYKVPKEFRLVESLPMTSTGKLVRYNG